MAACDIDIPHAASGVVTRADDDLAEFAATREFYRWMVDVTECLQQTSQDIADLRQELIDAGVLP